MEPAVLAIGVAGVVVVVTAMAFVAGVRRVRRARDQLRSHGLDTEAEVLEVWQDGMGSYCVRYRYTPQGFTQPITRDEIAGCLRAMLPEVGERVSVRYDPEKPERARLQRDGC